MCGLVGMISSDVRKQHKDFMRLALYFDTLRGEDSTGVAAVRQNREVSIFKRAIPGFDFLNDPRYEGHLRLNDIVWIGHNRFGTMGAKTTLNAHPFMVEDAKGFCDIVGAHNGTLKNKYQLPKHLDFGTDSEALFNLINAEGAKEALLKCDGAWALTWWDANEDRLKFVRNKERPLWLAHSKDKKTILWASEAWMLHLSCGRAGLDIEAPYEIEVDTLYSIDGPAKMGSELSVTTEGGLVGKPANFFPPTTRTGGGSAATHTEATSSHQTAPAAGASTVGTTGSNVVALTSRTDGATMIEASMAGAGSSEASTSQTTSTSPTHGKPKKTSSSANWFKGFNGKLIGFRVAEEIVHNGCAWCEMEEITMADAFGWVADDAVVCHKCLTGSHNHQSDPLNDAVFELFDNEEVHVLADGSTALTRTTKPVLTDKQRALLDSLKG